ncbi:hypothetical protein [Nocardia sp. NPDC004722]
MRVHARAPPLRSVGSWRALGYLRTDVSGQATRLDAEAVFVPSLEHFGDGEAPGSLVQRLDVVTVHPESTYSRRVSPSLPA